MRPPAWLWWALGGLAVYAAICLSPLAPVVVFVLVFVAMIFSPVIAGVLRAGEAIGWPMLSGLVAVAAAAGMGLTWPRWSRWAPALGLALLLAIPAVLLTMHANCRMLAVWPQSTTRCVGVLW